MNITDLIAEFGILYDIGSLALPGFEEDEIKRLLEIQQYRLINQKIGGNNIYNSKFPDTNKRIDDLQGLITESVLLWGGLYSNYALVTLPSDFLHMVELSNNTSGVRRLAREIKLSEAPRVAETPGNNGVYLKQPVYAFVNTVNGFRKLRMYVDSERSMNASFDDIYCLYIKKPTNLTMVADATELTDFNDDVYHELVQGTVDHAKSIVTPELNQVSQQQLNKME